MGRWRVAAIGAAAHGPPQDLLRRIDEFAELASVAKGFAMAEFAEVEVNDLLAGLPLPLGPLGRWAGRHRVINLEPCGYRRRHLGKIDG
jgi:hypothetical protein